MFGEFRLDTMRRLLYTGSVPNPIPERLFHILLVLLEANGNIVTRDQLSARVWGDEGVTDSNLTQHLYLLRMLLGERKRERLYIITVPGKGYRLAAPVTLLPYEEEDADPLDDVLLGGTIESFRHYCQGSYLLERRTEPELKSAIESFEAALAIQPDYAPAWTGVARAHALLAEYWYVPAREAYPKARAAVRRALGLDANSSTAHAVYSTVLLFGDWDWARAEDEVKMSISLNPQSTIARRNATWYYLCSGDFANALFHVKQALFNEPASLSLQLLLGRVLTHFGRYDQAIAGMTNILAGDPAYEIVRRHRAATYLLAGKPREALDDLLAMKQSSDDAPFKLPLMARAYADLGNLRKARETYAQLKAMASDRHVMWWNLAIVSMGLGNANEALDYLQRSVAEREPMIILLPTMPWFLGLGDIPEFKKLVESLGRP